MTFLQTILWKLSNYLIRSTNDLGQKKEEHSKCPLCATGTMRWCGCSPYCSDYSCDKCGLSPEDWK